MHFHDRWRNFADLLDECRRRSEKRAGVRNTGKWMEEKVLENITGVHEKVDDDQIKMGEAITEYYRRSGRMTGYLSGRFQGRNGTE